MEYIYSLYDPQTNKLLYQGTPEQLVERGLYKRKGAVSSAYRVQVDGIRLVVSADAELFGAKRNDKATWLYLNQDCDKIVGDAFLCAEVGGELIGFTKPVAKTICEEFGIDMEDDAWKD